MTRICPSCGREASDEDRFCPSCHAFLDWGETGQVTTVPGPAATPPSTSQPHHEQTPRASGHRPPEPEAGSSPTEVPHSATDLAGRPILRGGGEALQVEPGGAAESAVEVHTSGNLVDEIHLSLTGSAATFGQVLPSVVHLYPGTSTTVTLRFAPAHGPDPRAGTHSWVLQATSPVHGGASRTLAGVIEVGVLHEGHAELRPQRSEGRSRQFTHLLVLSNRGNADWPAQVEAGSPSGVEVSGPAQAVQVEPAATVEVPITGRTGWHWIGSGRTHAFDVHVDQGSPHPPQPPILTGTRLQRALLPLWLVALVPVLIGLGIAAVAVFGGEDTVAVPNVATMSIADAKTELEQTGFLVQSTSAPDDIIEAGLVAATDPPIGTQLSKGFTVTMIVSTGPKPGDIQIPSVTGEKQAAAEEAIKDAGLTSDVRKVDSTEPKGRVVRTEPAAGVKVAEGTAVALFVSKGPPPVAVPALAGQGVTEAQATLSGLGLKNKVVHESSDTVDKDVVIRTDPETGSAKAGDTVTLFVSSGPKLPVEVPDLVGMSRDVATAHLEDLGLEARVVEVAHATADPEVVIGSVPPAGDEVSPESTVTLQVSTGPSTGPDGLLGLPADDLAVTTYVTENGGAPGTNPITLTNGVQLGIDEVSQTVASVTLADTFDGTLPAGLDWTHPVEEVSSRLGEPTSLGQTGPEGQLVGAWDVPFDRVIGIVVTFDPDSGNPQTIQLLGEQE